MVAREYKLFRRGSVRSGRVEPGGAETPLAQDPSTALEAGYAKRSPRYDAL